MIAKESIGIVFQIHRKKQKKTLKEVSEQMRCSISRLSKFENGQQFFDKSEIVRLYECIGLNFVIDPRIHEELHVLDVMMEEQTFSLLWQKFVSMK